MTNIVTLTREEYNELVKAKKRFDTMRVLSSSVKRKRDFLDSAFGILKDSFGKKSSSFYVSKMRLSWR